MLLLPLSFALIAAVAEPPAAPAPLSPAAASIVAADYAFADLAAKEGQRKAYLDNFHKDGLFFIPRPVKGIDYWTTRLEFDEVLQWTPTKVEASEKGDLGYSTGPWLYKASKEATDVVVGWYVNLWERDGAGPWKVRMDIGIATPELPAEMTAPTPLPRTTATVGAAPTVHVITPSDELLGVDKKFSTATSTTDIFKAYTNWVDSDARFYVKGHFPLGVAKLKQYLDPYPVAFAPVEAIISGGGDLGLTRGTLTRSPKDGKATVDQYIHIWKKVGTNWKLALEMEVPPETPAKP